MTPARAHVIRRAVVEVHAPATEDAFRFRQEVERWTADRLLPRLDAVVDALPQTDAAVRIERLEISVDCFGPADWTKEALSKLESELTAALLREWRTSGEDTERRRAIPHLQSFFETLAEYLETGTLSWTRSIRTQADFETEVEAWLALPGIHDLRPQWTALLEIRDVRKRLLTVLRPALIQRLLTTVFRVPEQDWREMAADTAAVRRAWPQKRARKSPKREATSIAEDPAQEPPSLADHSAIAPILTGPDAWDAWLLAETIEALVANWFVYSTGLVAAIVQRALEAATPNARSRAQLETISFRSEAFTKARKLILERTTDAKLDRTEPPAERPASSPAPLPTATPAGEAETLQRRTARPTPVSEGLFIQNAGLVLIAPFLNRLLERLELAGEGKLLDPPMAMAVMHFLASGQENAAEFQLVLPKVLCGWPIETPVQVPMVVSAQAREETHQLLVSAVEHWSVLKDTSPEGLQESFLTRSGKLTEHGKDEWLLQVEQRPYDMLIARLPWTFSMVKLPWMPRLLRTEWVD